MNPHEHKAVSKRLSYILRHRPDSIGLQLADGGWVEVEALLDGLALDRSAITLEQLRDVVETNPKQRFEFNEEQSHIRARQGHSVEVELGYTPVEPPEFLYHGTPESSVASILESGLQKRQRHHVHLSTEEQIMLEVARRRGRPVLLKVDAAGMHAQGYEFYLTANDVWLTDHVPPTFVRVDDRSECQ